MKYFLLFCACIAATSVMAADTLYQKQRLKRQYYQRELNLKWQQRQDKRTSASGPIDKQRLMEKQNQQRLRQQRLYQSQQNKIERDKSSSERLYEQQKFKREQNSQDLEFKWEKQ